jgi:hypothetical protein
MKTGRLHIRVRADLAEQIKDYADRHNTTLTRIIEEHFERLIKQEPVFRTMALGFDKPEDGGTCS